METLERPAAGVRPPTVIRNVPGRYNALGIAAHYLSRRQPFGSFRFADGTQTIDGQIQRDHYLFAFEGNRVVGYLGWALYDTAVAEHFARTGKPPPNDLANGRDVVWLFTAAADGRGVLDALIKAGRARYPGLRVMGVRHRKGGRKVIFDQPNRPRRTEEADSAGARRIDADAL